MKFDDSGSKKREKYDLGVIFEVPGPETPQNPEIFDFYGFPLPVPMEFLSRAHVHTHVFVPPWIVGLGTSLG